MSEESKDKTLASETADETNKEGNKAGDGKVVFTAEQQKELDAVLGRRIAEVNAKHKADLDEAVKKTTEDVTRTMNMSAKEREDELEKKSRAELAEGQKQVRLGMNKLKAIKEFSDLDIPLDLVDQVVDENEDKQKEKIASFSKAWAESLSKKVEEKLTGNVQKDVDPNVQKQKDKKPVVKLSF